MQDDSHSSVKSEENKAEKSQERHNNIKLAGDGIFS